MKEKLTKYSDFLYVADWISYLHNPKIIGLAKWVAKNIMAVLDTISTVILSNFCDYQ